MPFANPIVTEAKRMGRVLREPRHDFYIRHKPFQIQPFMLAPVWPGETMKAALIQARAVTKPINNPVIGWWLEHYLFYVKHRDLDGRADLEAFQLDPDHSMAAYDTAAVVNHYHAASSFNWVEMCLKRVVEEYFRDETETWNANAVDGLPLAKVNKETIANSAILDDNFVALADESITIGGDDSFSMSELDEKYRMWEFQRANRLTEMDYEDWLAQFGIRAAPEENHRPELIRYIRQWQYPSNTVDPATGVPASAVSWSVQEDAGKNRFFTEPGFIFGVTVSRPKVYFRNQVGNAADWMRDAYTWLPRILAHDAYASLKKFAETAGPFQVVSDAGGYWVDIKDLAIYGDQFLNFSVAGVNTANLVDLPTAALNTRYVASTDIDNLFPGTDKTLQQDGVVQLKIAGALMDTTPNMTRLR